MPVASAGLLNRTSETSLVYFGDKTGTVTYSDLAPGLPGLYQINATIPANVDMDSSVPLAISTAEHYHDQMTLAISQ